MPGRLIDSARRTSRFPDDKSGHRLLSPALLGASLRALVWSARWHMEWSMRHRVRALGRASQQRARAGMY